MTRKLKNARRIQIQTHAKSVRDLFHKRTVLSGVFWRVRSKRLRNNVKDGSIKPRLHGSLFWTIILHESFTVKHLKIETNCLYGLL